MELQSLNQSGTRTATNRVDWLLLICSVLFWGLYFLGLWYVLWAGFRQASSPPRMTGHAVVNQLGDVVEWSPEASNIVGKDMLYRDLFTLVPPTKRKDAREQYRRGLDGLPYQLPRLWLETREGPVKVEFERRDLVCLATFTR